MDATLETFRALCKLDSLVEGGTVVPTWLPDGRPVFTVTANGRRTFLTVDAQGAVKPFFDEARLADALGIAFDGTGVPFERFAPGDGETISFEVAGQFMELDLETYSLRRLDAQQSTLRRNADPRPIPSKYASFGAPPIAEIPSPDGRCFLTLDKGNLAIRYIGSDRLVRLSDDAGDRCDWNFTVGFVLAPAKWSPDGSRICAYRVDHRRSTKTPYMRYLGGTEHVEYVDQPRVGETPPAIEIGIFNIRNRRALRVGVTAGATACILDFAPDGRTLYFLESDVFGRWVQLVVADSGSGERRIVHHEERGGGFVNCTTDFSFMRFSPFTTLPGPLPTTLPAKIWLLGDARRFLWISEESGWRHIYLYTLDGERIAQLTSGEYPVANFEAVDEERGYVYFSAAIDPLRPYDSHVCRVSLAGGAVEQLTEGPGVHLPAFAPDRARFIDNSSAVDAPPVALLRKSDGVAVVELDRADTAKLEATGYRPPEEVRFRSADNEHDHFGVVYTPHGFDPAKKYPVIEVIYAGNFTVQLPRSYAPEGGLNGLLAALAARGFVAVRVETRGTPGRSKAFQDVADKHAIGAYETADHRAAIEAIASNRPWMDLDRVGIVGHSYGGFYTIRALLTEPDFYKAGYAAAPGELFPHAPQGIMEPYLGPYEDNWEKYEASCNAPLADKLEGALRIIEGTGDANTPMAMTMRLSDAFFRAGKHIEMCILPERNHGFMAAGETTMPQFLFDDALLFFERMLKGGGWER